MPGDDARNTQTLREEIARAERLSGELLRRRLSSTLKAQADAGRAFIKDARSALEAEDRERSAVLIKKSLALLEDAEQKSRP